MLKDGMRLRLAQCAIAALALAGSATAMADQFGVQLAGGLANHNGNKEEKIDLGGVWDPNFTFWPIGGYHFTLVGEAHVAYWHPTSGPNPNNVVEFGLGPVLRFERASGDIRPYVEWGEGLRLLSHARINDNYTMSTAFQFSDMVGVGVKFGDRAQYQVGFRFQHMSNASIKHPNPGVNFEQLLLQYNF
ncbi:MAG: acyloxyacyl hydrolase [Janthinobacterium lividum]